MTALSPLAGYRQMGEPLPLASGCKALWGHGEVRAHATKHQSARRQRADQEVWVFAGGRGGHGQTAEGLLEECSFWGRCQRNEEEREERSLAWHRA